MDDSKNQHELVGCPDLEAMHLGIPNKTEQPAKPSPEVMGFNSAVTKPETRVNKAEEAGQPLEEGCPLLGELKPNQRTICDNCTEQPNKQIKTGCAIPDTNLKIIEEIEGLMSQVGDKIWELNVPTTTDSTQNKELSLKYKATEEIDLFQKTTLFELRKTFEC